MICHFQPPKWCKSSAAVVAGPEVALFIPNDFSENNINFRYLFNYLMIESMLNTLGNDLVHEEQRFRGSSSSSSTSRTSSSIPESRSSHSSSPCRILPTKPRRKFNGFSAISIGLFCLLKIGGGDQPPPPPQS